MAPQIRKVKDLVPLEERHPLWLLMACSRRCGAAAAINQGESLWQCAACEWRWHPDCAKAMLDCSPGDEPTSKSKWYCDACCATDDSAYQRGLKEGLIRGEQIGRKKTARKSANRPSVTNMMIRKNFICQQTAKKNGLASGKCCLRFESSKKLWRHEKAVHSMHGGKDLFCHMPGCDFATAWPDSLKTHLKSCANKREKARALLATPELTSSEDATITTVATMPPFPIE